MSRRFFARLAAWLPALAFGSLLAACQHQPEMPSPHCSIPATVRSFVTRDSCRSFVLQLASEPGALLRPTGQLWQSFLPKTRDGQRVFIAYVTATDSSSSGCRVPLSRPVRLTCLSADTTRLPKPPVLPHDTIRVPRDTTKGKP